MFVVTDLSEKCSPNNPPYHTFSDPIGDTPFQAASL